MKYPGWRDDDDWREALKAAGEDGTCPRLIEGGPHRSMEDWERPPEIVPSALEAVLLVDGENDGPSWLGVFRLRDHESPWNGCWIFVTAWCDYTGWDCQAGGCSYMARTREDLWTWGISREERERLVEAAARG